MSLTTESALFFTSGPMLTGNATGSYNRPFSDGDILASAFILLSLMVLGIVGNLITIIVIATSTRLKSIFNLFILSLCASDLTSAIISPLFLYRRTWGYDKWNIPSFFCKIYWAVDMWTSYVTALHILLFSILRLISVRWPHSYSRIMIMHARICIVLIWCGAFLTGFIPFAYWYNSGERRRNTDDIDARWPACTLEPEWNDAYSLYQMIAFTIFFYMPIVLVISLTAATGILLTLRVGDRNARLQKNISSGVRTSIKKSARKEKEAMVQLSMIAGSFILGYIPFTVYEISSLASNSATAADERFWWKFGMAEYMCLRISETLNPVFYNLASPKLRRETFLVMGRACSIIRVCCDEKIGRQSNPPVISSESHGLPKLSTLAYADNTIS